MLSACASTKMLNPMAFDGMPSGPDPLWPRSTVSVPLFIKQPFILGAPMSTCAIMSTHDWVATQLPPVWHSDTHTPSSHWPELQFVSTLHGVPGPPLLRFGMQMGRIASVE